MHIVLAILAVVGAAGYWLWRIQSAAHATRDIVDAVETVGGAIRRRRFRARAETNPIELIEDPREAAVTFLVALARVDGDLTDRQRRTIEEAARGTMQADNPAELVARARWLNDASTDPSNLVLRFARLFQGALGETERRQLVSIAEAVAAVEGPPSGIQRHAIEKRKERLGL